jgi:hypothetical protein
MKTTFALTRVPHHLELRRALARLPRTARDSISASMLRDHQIDLAAALGNDDPEVLSPKQRRVIAQAMHDRGAAFMLSSMPESAEA